MTLLAGWAALLSRLSGQAEVVIGTPVANRQRGGSGGVDRVFREHAGAAAGSGRRAERAASCWSG